MINMRGKENRGIVCWPVLVHRPVEHKTKRASSYHHHFHHHHHHYIINNFFIIDIIRSPAQSSSTGVQATG